MSYRYDDALNVYNYMIHRFHGSMYAWRMKGELLSNKFEMYKDAYALCSLMLSSLDVTNVKKISKDTSIYLNNWQNLMLMLVCEANASIKMNDLEKALRTYQYGLQLFGKTYEVMMGMAYLFETLGRVEEALSIYTTYSDMYGSEGSRARYNLLMSVGREKEAFYYERQIDNNVRISADRDLERMEIYWEGEEDTDEEDNDAQISADRDLERMEIDCEGEEDDDFTEDHDIEDSMDDYDFNSDYYRGDYDCDR